MKLKKLVQVGGAILGAILTRIEKVFPNMSDFFDDIIVWGGTVLLVGMVVWFIIDQIRIFFKNKSVVSEKLIKPETAINSDVKITLKEAAIRSYEQLKNDQNWFILDKMLPTQQKKLGYCASEIILHSRINIYGEKPPSRILERISFREHDINSYALNDDLNAFYYRGEGNKEPQWQNLQIKEVDFNQFIENVKKERHLN